MVLMSCYGRHLNSPHFLLKKIYTVMIPVIVDIFPFVKKRRRAVNFCVALLTHSPVWPTHVDTCRQGLVM